MATDEFTNYYTDLLDGSYDCVDRFVLNANFGLCYSPGGFRSWWRRSMVKRRSPFRTMSPSLKNIPVSVPPTCARSSSCETAANWPRKPSRVSMSCTSDRSLSLGGVARVPLVCASSLHLCRFEADRSAYVALKQGPSPKLYANYTETSLLGFAPPVFCRP